MLKTERAVKQKHREKEYFKQLRSTQEAIPIDTVYDDGMFLCRGKNGDIYSKTYRFSDVNYTVADKAKQEDMIRSLKSITKSCPAAEVSQITIINRHINKELLANLMYEPTGDETDKYRKELNHILAEQSGRGTGIIQERYFTLSTVKTTPKDAQLHFDRTGEELSRRFAGMGSQFVPLGLSERLRLLHDFYCPGNETYWRFPFADIKERGHSFKDSIAPMSMQLDTNHFRMGDKYGRVLAMKEYANWIDDRTLNRLASLDTEMVISVTFFPVPTDEAVKLFQNQLMKVEKNSVQRSMKQMERTKMVLPESYEFKQDRAAITEIMEDVTSRDCGLVIATITLCHLADSLDKLNSDTDLIRTVARDMNCEFDICTAQQLDALNTALPYGTDRLDMDRSLTTEGLAAFVPFNAQEIYDTTGIYYGQNAVTRNLVVVDRAAKSSGHCMVLGQTGGGKSFFSKEELTELRLKYSPVKADFLIVDPENEYGKVVTALGGEVYNVGSDSINPFDIELDRTEKQPLAYKTDFITTFCEKVADGGIDAQTKSLIDRAVRNVYKDYLRKDGKAPYPLLRDFRSELEAMKNPRADELSLALERFVEGSLNTFSQPTNIDSNGSMLCYNISGLRDQIKPLGMLITLDQLLNRVMRNHKKGKMTFVYCDEFSLLFQDEATGAFFSNLWRRVRKYNGFCTGATQNVEEILDSESGRTMLSLSDFVVILNQSPTNAEKLSELYKISQEQEVYFRNVQPGHGLIKVGGALVPFVNHVPHDTELYKLFTTNPREGSWD